MKKIKFTFLLAGLLSMWQLKAQIAPPVGSQTIAAGNQNLNWQTTTGTDKWYSFQNTTADAHVILDIMQQGLEFKCTLLKLYVKNAGSLYLVSTDSLYAGESRLEVFAPNRVIGSDLFLQVSNLTFTCTTCTPQNPTFNLSILNRAPGCTGYVQPTCEFVKDGGFEFFNGPCSTIDIVNIGTDLDAQFAPCFWTLPGPLGVVNTTRGSADYFNACAPVLPVGVSTNATSNYFNNPYTTTTHTGDGYIGLHCYSATGSEYREYVSDQLATNLTTGAVYNLSMYVRLSRNSNKATDKIQAFLSTTLPTQIGTARLSTTGGQLINVSSSVISNVAGWTYITATFTATGNYSNLTLGNFIDDATLIPTLTSVAPTAYIAPGTLLNSAYYFIDDVSIVQKPTFSVTPVTTTYCAGAPPTVTLSVITPTTGATYTWLSSLGSVLTGTSIVVSPTTSINYTVTSSLGGCLNTAFTSITLVPLYPIPALVTSTNVVCPGGVFDININPVATSAFFGYTFNVNPSGFTGGSAGVSAIPTYTTGINLYSVTINNPSGTCPTTTTLSIYVQPYPSYSIAPNPLCPGATATLTGSGIYIQPLGMFTTAMFVDWGDGAVDNVLDSTKTHSYTTPGTYTLSITGQNYLRCSNTSTLTLTVTAIPNVSVSASQTICEGSSLTFTAGGAVSYTWQPGGIVSNSITVAPTATTIYTVTGTGVCGGTAIKTVTATVKPKPTISITSTLTNLCSAASSGSNTVLSYVISPAGSTLIWNTRNATTGISIGVPITSSASSATVNLTSFINYTANINIILTVVNAGCVNSQTITLFACCTPTSGVTKYTNTTFASSTAFSSTPIILSGSININSATLTFNNTNVYLDPNTKITLNGTGGINAKTAYMHGCNAMWDGIYAIGSSNSVQINTSRIEDAKRAIIDSLGTAKITITNSYFNKNQMGIVLRGTKPATAIPIVTGNLFTCSTISVTPSSWFSVLPIETNSTVIGAFPSTTLLPPYNTYNSYCGVYLASALQAGITNSLIPIGTSTANVNNTNIFDKMKAGIVSGNSNMDVKNNIFQNITSAMNNPGVLTIPSSGAIFVVNFFGPAATMYNNIGGSVATKNTFYNNEYGVYNIGRSTLNVLYNKFENQTNGVYVYANNNNLAVNVTSNKFINNTLGINFDQNNPINSNVQTNWFDNTVSCGNTASNFAMRFTENVLVTTPTSFPKYDVFNNYINGYYNGIKAAQTFSIQIRDNEVHMRQDLGAWNFQFGIHITGGNNNAVFNNLVDVPAPNSYWWQSGIFTDQSTVPKIHCNTINNLCYAISANSFNFTTAGDGFYGNTMKNAVQGFRLDANGEIGNQYKPGPVSADNAWIGCTNETSTGTSCNMSGSVFYTRSTTPYSIISPITVGGIQLFGNPTTASTGTCYAGVSTPTLGLRLGGAAGLAQLMQKGDDIANNAIGFTGSYASSLKQIARKQLYSHLVLQQIDPSVTANVNAFANSSRMQPTGRFFIVDSLINTGDSAKLNNADILNTSIRVIEDVDVTQKQFNSLYISYLKNNNKVTANTVADFESIAWLCPTQFGSAVHQARTVLFNITKKRYYNACELGNTSIKAKEYTPPVNNTVFLADINVYPNPANDLLFIDAKDYSYIDIKLYNIMGELVIEKTIDETNSSLDVSKLANGIYVYKAFNNGLEIKVGKLVISK